MACGRRDQWKPSNDQLIRRRSQSPTRWRWKSRVYSTYEQLGVNAPNMRVNWNVELASWETLSAIMCTVLYKEILNTVQVPVLKWNWSGTEVKLKFFALQDEKLIQSSSSSTIFVNRLTQFGGCCKNVSGPTYCLEHLGEFHKPTWLCKTSLSLRTAHTEKSCVFWGIGSCTGNSGCHASEVASSGVYTNAIILSTCTAPLFTAKAVLHYTHL